MVPKAMGNARRGGSSFVTIVTFLACLFVAKRCVSVRLLPSASPFVDQDCLFYAHRPENQAVGPACRAGETAGRARPAQTRHRSRPERRVSGPEDQRRRCPCNIKCGYDRHGGHWFRVRRVAPAAVLQCAAQGEASSRRNQGNRRRAAGLKERRGGR